MNTNRRNPAQPYTTENQYCYKAFDITIKLQKTDTVTKLKKIGAAGKLLKIEIGTKQQKTIEKQQKTTTKVLTCVEYKGIIEP